MLQQKLERKLGLFPVTNIVIANIIGAGIFTTTGYLMGYLNHPLVMLMLWVAGGIIAFCGALAFGELGAAFPEAGGEYMFISKLFNPLWGFLSGWLSLIVGFSAPIAASAIGFSKYFIRAFPNFQNHVFLYDVLSSEHFSRLVAIFIILIFTFIHSRNIIFGARVQNGLTALKIILVLGLIIAGFAAGEGSFQDVRQAQAFQLNFENWKAVGLSLMFIMFAYSGWNSATYIGSEIRNPQKTIPRSLFISTGLVMVLYVGLNLFFIYAIPANKMLNEPEIGGIAAGLAFGAMAETIISLLISFALFSSLSAFIILGPRVYYRMAKDGLFFRSLAAVHPKNKVPVNAIYLQCFLAIVMVLSGTFEQIIIYMGFSLGLFPILAVAGVFRLRKRGIGEIRLPGFPVVHIVFIVSGLAMLLLAYFERPLESTVAVFTALSGIPVYYWFKRKREN